MQKPSSSPATENALPNDYEVVLFSGIISDNSHTRTDPVTGRTVTVIDKVEGRTAYMASELGIQVRKNGDVLDVTNKAGDTFTLTPKALNEYVLAHIADNLSFSSVYVDKVNGSLMGVDSDGAEHFIDAKKITPLLHHPSGVILDNFSIEHEAKMAALGLRGDIEIPGGELVTVAENTSSHPTHTQRLYMQAEFPPSEGVLKR